MKRFAIIVVGLTGAGLVACSSGAPMAPVGLDKHPANSPGEVALLTARQPASEILPPVPAASPGAAGSQAHVETASIRNIEGFTFSDFSAPGGFMALPSETRDIVLSAARSSARVKVLCRTDRVKASKTSRELALRKGAAVRRFLISQGVPPEKVRLYVRSTGAFVADNGTVAGKAKNRRVEIQFS